MNEQLRPTLGPWTYLAGTSTCEKVMGADGKVVADGWWCRDVAEVDANSRLIAEAGTVFHECGLSPRELLEGCRELRKALDELYDECGGYMPDTRKSVWRDASAALAKHKEV